MKLKLYTVKRYLVESYQVEAHNRKEALEECLKEGGLYEIEIKKITVRREKKQK